MCMVTGQSYASGALCFSFPWGGFGAEGSLKCWSEFIMWLLNRALQCRRGVTCEFLNSRYREKSTCNECTLFWWTGMSSRAVFFWREAGTCPVIRVAPLKLTADDVSILCEVTVKAG